MAKVKFVNKTNSIVQICLFDINENIDINPNEDVNIELNQNSITFILKEVDSKSSFIERILGTLLAVLVSIILWFLNYFEADSIEEYIKFPVKFSIDHLQNNTNNVVEIFESSKRFMLYDAKVNKMQINGHPEYSKELLSKQVKDYKKSKYIVMIFPCIVISVLWIISLVSHNVLLLLSTLIVSLVALFFFCKKEKKDKKSLAEISKKFTNNF